MIKINLHIFETIQNGPYSAIIVAQWLTVLLFLWALTVSLYDGGFALVLGLGEIFKSENK